MNRAEKIKRLRRLTITSMLLSGVFYGTSWSVKAYPEFDTLLRESGAKKVLEISGEVASGVLAALLVTTVASTPHEDWEYPEDFEDL